jgi:Zn-dependent M28 family amino/carboxypeptidase
MGSFYNSIMSSGKRVVLALSVVSLVVAIEPRAAAAQLDGQALVTTVATLASAEFAGRRTGSAGGLKARAWVADSFTTIGLATLDGKYVFPFRFTHNKVEYTDAANVVGLCRGTTGAPETVVLSAHYDHLGVRNGALHPGADDNASGIAVLLAIAAECQRRPFRHDTLFVAFDGEEQGLQGAREFVARPPVAKERLALNINLDMVSRSSKGELYAAGTYHWPATKRPLEDVAKRAAVKLLFGHDKPEKTSGVDDWTLQSDHGPFHTAGIPFVYFGVEDHPDYHQPTDTADKIDPTFFRQSAQTILDAVITLNAALPFGK